MRIGIYGLGRFGAFFAGLLSSKVEIQAYSRNPDRPAPVDVAHLRRHDHELGLAGVDRRLGAHDIHMDGHCHFITPVTGDG